MLVSFQAKSIVSQIRSRTALKKIDSQAEGLLHNAGKCFCIHVQQAFGLRLDGPRPSLGAGWPKYVSELLKWPTKQETVWLLILLAGNGNAQWRHFGPGLAHDMLAAHNAVRATAEVAPLVWSDHLAAISQEWADTLLSRKQFVHSRNAAYGENLFEIRGGAASPAKVVEAWAAESRQYDYATNQCRGVCGHYTQIVWSSTKAVGCAVARGDGREVWVCEYDPPGNWVGQRPY
jgi:uncharacterized protein YkwD